ncbi:sodium-dependent transporter [Clostridium polynesiense]|uniref:sodium-dependent transporter n=1 Tax=Clostridium polynesiense TaxID=1325933 RepID=UPI00058F8C38|nr:sodium-dependent transporter [Clostridium polynesiense]
MKEKINVKGSKVREQFSGKLGLVLACVGAAVGLGNIWMFPYKLGQYGGAAFLIPYFIFVFILGTAGIMVEMAFGRYYKKGSMSGIRLAFKEKNIRGGSILSAVPTLGLAGIFVFYTVVVGWVLKYFTVSLSGQLYKIDTEVFFNTFTGSNESILWHGAAVLLTVFIVTAGVSKGIEKINKIMMPCLFIIFILLALRSLSLPGAVEGVKYLLYPKWELLLSPKTWIMALGQAFFTVSLTGCALVVYGSYADEKVDLPSAAIQTALFDTLAAILAAFVIIPAVFAYGLDPGAGPALLFVTVPSIFKAMPMGALISALFFLSIIFASLSSCIVMLEGPVEAAMSELNLNRKKAAVIIAVICFLIGIPMDLNTELFSKFSDFITIYITPIGALIVAVTFFYIVNPKTALKEINVGAGWSVGNYFIPFIKYGFTLITLAVIVLGVIYGGIG